MIRIYLTAGDVERIRVADTPDFSSELVRAAYQLALRFRCPRLSQWHKESLARLDPGAAILFDLYSPAVLPAIFDQVVRPDPAATAAAAAGIAPGTAANYLRTLTRTRELTPFTRALAEGRSQAYTALGQAIADLQAAALDPYRRRMTLAVSTAAAKAAARLAYSGPDVLLRDLGRGIRWNDNTLSIDTVAEARLGLEGRRLILQPTVIAARPGLSGDLYPDALVLYYPTAENLIEDAPLRAPGQALATLLGAARAAALVAIVDNPALSTGQLAATIGLSPTAASRHAIVLRQAGLITTWRTGMAVHHSPTPLGNDLAVLTGD